MPTQTLTVPDESDDLRLDRFLASALALSRSQLQRLIKDGSVLVAGRTAKANQPVKTGQEISIDVPEPIEAAPAPEDLPLPIVYQDKDLIVVDKPAGWWCTRRRDTRAAPWSMRCFTTWTISAESEARSVQASCIGSTRARRG
jgi:23S rRNA-/tRNA-specific pseudouridylate synthase